MAILGSTAEPTGFQEWFGLNSDNQHAMLFTMPAGGPWRITRVGVWAAGKDATPTARVCLWSPSGTLIRQSNAFTMSSRSFALGQNDLYEHALTSTKDIDGGNQVWAGYVRDNNESAQHGYNSGGSHLDHNTTSEPTNINTGATHSGTMGIYIVYEAANTAPNAPTIVSPTQNQIVNDTTPLIDWTFSDPDAGDSQSAYEVEIDDNSNFSSLVVNTGKIVSTSTSFTSPALNRGTTYYVRVRTWDQSDVVSAWSSTRTIKIAALPTTSVTSPSADGVAAPMYYTAGSDTNPKFKVSWSFSCPDGGTQSSAIIRIKDSAGTSTLHTHNASGTSTTANISGYQPTNGTIYSVSVQVTCSHGAQSSETTATSRNMRARWGRAAYRADLTTAPLTLSSSVSSTTNSGQVIVEYGSNSTTTEPTDWKATIAEVTKQRYIWHRVTLLPNAVAAPTSPALNSVTLTYSANVLSPDDWDTSNGGSEWVMDEGTYVYGTVSMKIATHATTNRYVWQDVDVIPNTDYILSGRMKTLGNALSRLRVYEGGANSVQIAFTDFAPADTDWTRYTVAFNSGELSQVRVMCHVLSNSNGSTADSTAWFDALKLEASQVVTPWTPGFMGKSVVLDAGGLVVDAMNGGVFRLRSEIGTMIRLKDGGLRIESAGDASATSTNHAFQIGDSTGANVRFDTNEIMAASNGVAVGLNLNADGGDVTFGNNASNPSKILAGDGFWGPKMRLYSTGDASLVSTAHAFQVGDDASANLIIDNNEIMARNNGSSSTLHLNIDGGSIVMGSNGSGTTVQGVLNRNNEATGSITITPVSGSPTAGNVTGLSLNGTGFIGLVTAGTSVPGSIVEEVSMTGASSTGGTVYIYRNSGTATGVYWIILGK